MATNAASKGARDKLVRRLRKLADNILTGDLGEWSRGTLPIAEHNFFVGCLATVVVEAETLEREAASHEVAESAVVALQGVGRAAVTIARLLQRRLLDSDDDKALDNAREAYRRQLVPVAQRLAAAADSAALTQRRIRKPGFARPAREKLAEIREAIRFCGKTASTRKIQTQVSMSRGTLLAGLRQLYRSGEYAGFKRKPRAK